MATPTPRYEITDEQNQMIGRLAGKMKFVGFFAILAGVINLIMAILLVAAIYQDRIPEEWKTKTSEYLQQVRDKLPDSVRHQAEQYSLDRLPPNNQLWGITINTLAIGVFLLLLGAWTRSAGESFQKIVKTRGSDMSHLMDGVASLDGMYSIFYWILVLLLTVGAISLGLAVYKSFWG